MRTPTNSMPVRVFKPEPVTTSYPITSVDDNGNETLVYKDIPDNEINNIDCSDLSLRSLINAGVDPSRMRIDTTRSSNRAFLVSEAASEIASINFDEIDNLNNNPNEPTN